MYTLGILLNRFITYLIPLLSIALVILPWITGRKRITYRCSDFKSEDGKDRVTVTIINSGLSSIDAQSIYGQKLYLDCIGETTMKVVDATLKSSSSYLSSHIYKTGKESDKVEIYLCDSKEFSQHSNDSSSQVTNNSVVYVLEPFKPRDYIELELEFVNKPSTTTDEKKKEQPTEIADEHKKDEQESVRQSPAAPGDNREKQSIGIADKTKKDIRLTGDLRGFGAKIKNFNNPFNFLPLNILLPIAQSLAILAVIFIMITAFVIYRYLVYSPENDRNGRNNTLETANEIVLNKNYWGRLSNSFEYEEDWFTFMLDTPSRLSVEFRSQPQPNSTADYWDIKIRSVDAGNGNPDIDPIIWRSFVSGETGTLVSSAIPLPAGRYYFEIESSDYYTHDLYSFILRAEPLELEWESEPNNTMENANELSFDQEKYGRLIAPFESEKDWYVIKLDEPEKISIKLSTQRQHNDNADYWEIQLLNEEQAISASGGVVNEAAINEGEEIPPYIWQKFVAGDETDTTYTTENELGPGKYYIKIESSDKFSRSFYSVVVTE